MTGPLRLVIFDVDGTLVDSQNDICASMQMAYQAHGLAEPNRRDVLGIVGLSLGEAFSQLSPELDDGQRISLVSAYKSAYAELRRVNGANGSPLFPGAREVLEDLNAHPETLLAIATGKSQRGLDSLIDVHGLHGMFASRQVADHHPSKPHPSMVLACMSDTGVEPEQAVMIGDTSYDMDMARAAGVATIGVSWGYHAVDRLGADRVVDTFGALPGVISEMFGDR